MRRHIPTSIAVLAPADFLPAVAPCLQVPCQITNKPRSLFGGTTWRYTQLRFCKPDGVRLLASGRFLWHVTADSSSHLGNSASKDAYSSRGARLSPFECLKTSARCRHGLPRCG